MSSCWISTRACVVMAVLSVSCSTDIGSPLAPVPTSAPVPPVNPAPPPVVSGVTYPAGTYNVIDARGPSSQFVLGDDGRFVLRSETSDYRGTYTYASTGLITFAWEGWSTAGPWEAWGLLRGDVMAVSFNPVMQLSDFEDASYRRVEPSSSSTATAVIR